MTRLIGILLLITSLSACSGAIYRQSGIKGADPVAITVDARQRMILSQRDENRNALIKNPSFRRFCAEPSPDAFTVLGVSASAGGSFGQSADPKSLNAAIQGAFSSSETGTTIPRTQTINMLREMMFRTCERYLSGAISPAELSVVAARDQRIMVSVLAIEQLTGAITPRTVAISSKGNSSTGLNPSDMVQQLAVSQGNVNSAEEGLKVKIKKLGDVDTPGGTCAALKKKKDDGSPTLTSVETTKLKACSDAQAEVDVATVKRDTEKERYDDLVAASKRGLGISTASTEGTTSFSSEATEKVRLAAVSSVADSVENIVNNTFEQDETQLFCFRMLSDQKIRDALGSGAQKECLSYLITKVKADKQELADRYGITPAEALDAVGAGERERQTRENNGRAISLCAKDADRLTRMKQILGENRFPDDSISEFASAAASPETTTNFLYYLGQSAENEFIKLVEPICNEEART